MNTPVLGIRREDKNSWERRVPLSPQLVEDLVQNHGLEVRVERSPNRTWPDREYQAAGAQLVDSLEGCGLVFAVKEIPLEQIQPDAAHVFFSHTIKGQSYNMPLLKRVLDQKASLVDYELITDESGRRLVFFGKHAGYAGMIDSLSVLGGRLALEGRLGQLVKIRPAWRYADLAAAKEEIALLGADLDPQEGFAGADRPLVVGITGYGNVSQGAQEILRLLPHEEHSPASLLALDSLDGLAPDRLHLVVFREEDMFHRRDGGEFSLKDYFANPGEYESRFEDYLPRLDLLVNAIYWSPECPRLVTKEWIDRAWAEGSQGRLSVIGDISIDIEGSIQCSLLATYPDNPRYVYLAGKDEISFGLDGHGPVIVAVDNLPCELPRDSSITFSEALADFVPALAATDWSRPFAELELPASLKRALIAHQGKLCPDYAYLEEALASGTAV